MQPQNQLESEMLKMADAIYNANVNGDGIQEAVCILKMVAGICLET